MYHWWTFKSKFFESRFFNNKKLYNPLPHQLTIVNVSLVDRGIYTCTATNQAGKVNQAKPNNRQNEINQTKLYQPNLTRQEKWSIEYWRQCTLGVCKFHHHSGNNNIGRSPPRCQSLREGVLEQALSKSWHDIPKTLLRHHSTQRMIIYPPKSEHFSPKIDHHQQSMNIYPKSNHLLPKMVIYALFTSKCRESHLRAFVVKSTRVPGLG